MRAIISVFDKTGIVEFARELVRMHWEILSTGGTAKALRQAHIPVTEVSDYTGFPEIMEGRLKTLHPRILGGILADRSKKSHLADAKENKIEPIDIVVVNLYPFEETVKKKAGFDETIEMIDIGGPSMLRAAAKNFKHVIAVTDPKDYAGVIDSLKKGGISVEQRKELAHKVFSRTAFYDAEILKYLSPELFPDTIVLQYSKKQDMRYGENPHQEAAFYVSPDIVEPCISTAEQLQGKELSYNNIMDADAALEIVKEFAEPTAAVIKHANPSGVASASDIVRALQSAYEADALSAFGCVIALNRACTKKCAEFLKDKFVEVIVAEDFDAGALKLFSGKKNLRLLKLPTLLKHNEREHLTTKKVVGGLLVQTRDFPDLHEKDIKIVSNKNPSKEDIEDIIAHWKKTGKITFLCPTKKVPSKNQIVDMLFGVKVCKHVKSNSVILVKDKHTLGIGAGQMSRVDSSMIAVRKAGKKARGSTCVSDALFPFRHGVDAIAKAGVKTIIQPGGSIRDKEVIDACDEHGIAMVFTGLRLFLH